MKRKTLPLCISLALYAASLLSQPRIINGTPVTPPDYEWMAGLSNSSDPAYNFCGGVLIADDWVLTAAHCIESEQPQNVYAFFNAYSLSNPLSGFESVQSDSLIAHPDYDSWTNDNDIALVHLSQPVSIAPVLVPRPNDTLLITPGRMQTIMGWGTTDTFWWSFGADTLLEAQVPIVDYALCNSSISYDGELTENMQCAGYMTGGTDACQGDSGGPLLTQENNEWYVTGVVSWGYGCASPNFPGIYTKVLNYYDWIQQHIDSLPIPAGIDEAGLNRLIHIQNDGGMLSISSDKNVSLQQVQVINMSGELMVEKGFSSNGKNQVDLTGFAHGLYVARLMTGNGMVTKKIIL